MVLCSGNGYIYEPLLKIVFMEASFVWRDRIGILHSLKRRNQCIHRGTQN